MEQEKDMTLEWSKKKIQEILPNLSLQMQCLKPSMRGAEDMTSTYGNQSIMCYSKTSGYFTATMQNPSINSQQSEQDFNWI